MLCKMENIFLLIISLITGFEASAGIKGCLRDWTELTCKNLYSEQIEINISTINHEQNNHINVCEERISVPLFQYVKNKELRLMVRWLKEPKSSIHEMIEIVADGCHASGQTDKTFRCYYPYHYQSKIKLVCSNKEFTCEKLPTHTSQDSNWKSRRKMPSVNTGVTWCKIKEKETKKDHDRLTLRVTDITTFTKSPTTGENFTYFCKYNVNFKSPDIFICKGEDPTDCQVVLNTKTALENQRFTMKNNKSNVTITVTKVTASDSGTYWCGAENRDKNNRIFMHRFFLNVVPTSTSPALSTTSSSFFVTTSMPPSSKTTAATGGLSLGVMTSIIIGAVGLMLLLLVIVTFSLFKRCVCSEEARDRSSEQHPKEECIYEVIPDGQQTTVTSVYATVNFPTNDPASLYYSTISFQTSSTENIDGEPLVLKPFTSSCQYSVLKYSQSSTSQTDPPTRSTDEPLYSAVKNPHLKKHM